MKTAIIDGEKQFKIIDKDIPKSDGQRVVIKVAYTGICGSDLHYWGYGNSWTKGWIMGHEFTGYVEDPGSREDLKPGDRVLVLPSKACQTCEYCKEGNTNLCEAPITEAIGIGTPGAYAEYVMVRPHVVIKLEDNVEMTEATLVEPASVGYYGVKKSKLSKGESVLIVGAGIIGLMTGMWAKKAGARKVTIVDTGENRLEKAREYGVADETINAKDPDAMDRILSANDGKMYDILFECVGKEETFNHYIRSVKPGGKLVILGIVDHKIPFDFNAFVVRNMEMIGSHAWNFSDFKEVLQELTAGNINLKQFITQIVPLVEVQSAFEDLTSADTKNVKVLLKA